MKSLILALLLMCGLSFAGEPYTELRQTAVRLPLGSGSIVQAKSGHKYVITNWHVCLASQVDGVVSATFPEGTTLISRVKAYDSEADICILDFLAQKSPALVLGKSPALHDTIYSRGFPLGILTESVGTLGPSITYDYTISLESVGECPKSTRKLYAPNGILYGCEKRFYNNITTLYAQPGSSGSPVVDSHGEIVGIVQSYHPGQGGGIVPYSFLRRFLEKF